MRGLGVGSARWFVINFGDYCYCVGIVALSIDLHVRYVTASVVAADRGRADHRRGSALCHGDRAVAGGEPDD